MRLDRLALVAAGVALSAAACGGKDGATATSPTSVPAPIQTIVQVTGSLYILSQEYLGPISGLSAATSGFVARSIRIESGEYVFDSAVVLRPGVTYWFMADSDVQFFASIGTTDVYPGGDLYTGSTQLNTSPFRRYVPIAPTDRVDASFLLRGSLTTAP